MDTEQNENMRMSEWEEKSMRSLELGNLFGVCPSSLERVLPIPRCMLSQSQSLDKEREVEEEVEEELNEEEQAGLVAALRLDELNSEERPSQTKNVLRNFGNAQNQYVLYHRQARCHLQTLLRDVAAFDLWVRSLRLEKFEDFQRVWKGPLSPGQGNRHSHVAFHKAYRAMCFRFYAQNAVPYVLASRIKNDATKRAHLLVIHRFLEGLKHPNDFLSFKKNFR